MQTRHELGNGTIIDKSVTQEDVSLQGSSGAEVAAEPGGCTTFITEQVQAKLSHHLKWGSESSLSSLSVIVF